MLRALGYSVHSFLRSGRLSCGVSFLSCCTSQFCLNRIQTSRKLLLLFAFGLTVAGTHGLHSQTVWTKYPGNPVLSSGPIGSWDYYWMSLGSILRRDSIYVMWYSGSADGFKPRTGRATSRDGITWQKDTLSPVLSPSPPVAWDDSASFIPKVLFTGSLYSMWYSGWTGANYGWTQIGHATSLDGVSWRKDSLNPVLRFGPPGSWNESYLDPMTVLYDGSVYRLWSAGGSGGGFPGTSSAIGYATSPDGIHWTQEANNPVLTSGPPGSWDERGVGMGAVIYDQGYFHMWYVGNVIDWPNGFSGIGYAVSSDGIHWRKYPGNPVIPRGAPDAWDAIGGYHPVVIKDGSIFRMWYSGNSSIGFATAPRSPARITLRSRSIDFRNVFPGTDSDSAHLVFENWGFTPLVISSLLTSRAEFRIGDSLLLPLVVPPFDLRDVRVVFRPTQAGVVVVDSLAISCNDSTNPRPVVTVRGRGSGAIAAAPTEQIYGISASPDATRLYGISRTTGEATDLAQLSPHPPPSIQGFAIRGLDKMIYAACTSVTGTLLYRVSTTFGDLESAGGLPLAGVTAMAFNAGDTLYLADGRGRVYRTKGIGADTVFVGNPGVIFSGLAFNPATGVLWGSAHDTIYTIDVSTGRASRVGSGSFRGAHSSITFSPLGTLYALFDNMVVTVDKVTGGVASQIGPTGEIGLSAVAMRSDTPTGVSEPEPPTPAAWQLLQNYPNPFNPVTTIGYALAAAGRVSIKVYDLLGREVATLVDGFETAGRHTVTFDARNLSTGLYWYGMRSGSFAASRKLLVIR